MVLEEAALLEDEAQLHKHTPEHALTHGQRRHISDHEHEHDRGHRQTTQPIDSVECTEKSNVVHVQPTTASSSSSGSVTSSAVSLPTFGLHSWSSLSVWGLDARDFACGCVAGCAITLSGQPFDTCKVRVQVQSVGELQQFKSAVDTAITAIRNEGALSLWKGMSSPLVTVPVINAIVFGAFEQAKRWAAKWEQNNSTQLQAHGQYIPNANPNEIHSEASSLSLKQPPSTSPSISASAYTYSSPPSAGALALCGGYAGLLNSVVVCPVELLKCKLQLQVGRTESGSGSIANSGESGSLRYLGLRDVINKTVHVHGYRGLFLGMNATILREVPAYAAQFGSYEWMKFKLIQRKAKTLAASASSPQSATSTVALSHLEQLFVGGVAGLACWLCSYPADLIKSKLQAQFERPNAPIPLPAGAAAAAVSNSFAVSSPNSAVRTGWDSISTSTAGRRPVRLYSVHYILGVFGDGGIISCAKSTMAAEGLMGFWRGFAACATRAIIANAVGFYVYETCRNTLFAP